VAVPRQEAGISINCNLLLAVPRFAMRGREGFVDRDLPCITIYTAVLLPADSQRDPSIALQVPEYP